MRVAYVTADAGVPVFGRKGCSVHVREVIRAFRRYGARVEVFTTRLGGVAPADLDGVRVHVLPTGGGDDMPARERESLAVNRPLRAALKNRGPFDLVYERYSLWGYAGMEYARHTGAAGVLEVNAPLIEEQSAYRGLADRAAAERVAGRAFAAAGALAAVSEAVARYLDGFPAARGKVHVVPNGVDPNRFPPGLRPSHPGPAGSFTVGFVGTLKPWHGLPVLVEAFERLHRGDPSTRLLIVGDGPERAALDADLHARGLGGATTLTGAVEADEVPGLLASMDAAAAPYPARDGYWLSYGGLLLRLAEAHPTLPRFPDPAAVVVRPDQMPKGYVFAREGTPRGKAVIGKWPDFALDARPLKGEPNPKPLGPCKPAEFSAAVRGFIEQTLADPDRKRLGRLEGRWPEYPQELARIARERNLAVPGVTLPGEPKKWEQYYRLPSGKK